MSVPNYKRPLAGLLGAQFLGAFNDNAFKFIVALLAGAVATKGLGDQPELAEQLRQSETTWAFVIFTLPFIFFSLPAAFFADRFSKRNIIIAMKVVEVAVMVGATVSLWVAPDAIWPLLLLVGGMGLQSALFSPAKYGILPEVLPHSRLSHGNALLEMWTFLAIIGGYAVGGALLDLTRPQVWHGALLLAVLAVVGLITSFWVPRVPAVGGKDTAATVREAWRAILSDRYLRLTILGSMVFWTVASLLGQDVLVYAKEALGVKDTEAGATYAVFGIGVGAGAMLSARISGHRIEVGIIPLGALGLSIGTILMGVLEPAYTGTLVFMSFLGICSGLLIVPLEAMLQWCAPRSCRGAVIAIANIPIFIGVLLGSLLTNWMAQLGASAATIIIIAGIGSLAGTIWALWLLPSALLRMSLVILTNTFYRLRVLGRDHIPTEGGALIVANHVSLADGLFLIASTDRKVRFLVDSEWYHKPLVKPLLKLLDTIPISGKSTKELLRAMKTAGEYLEQGEVLCIFAEGEITRTGAMLPFRRGIERILKGRDVPVIACHLDRVWGSVFSPKGGGFMRSLNGPIPRPVTVSFSEPMPSSTPVGRLRQRVTELSQNAFCARDAEREPLHFGLIRGARRSPLGLCVADATRKLSRIRTLAGSVALARQLREEWQDQPRVGILLPPSIGSALANFAALLAGRTSVNLNFTAGKDGLASAARQAGLQTVVTSRQFLERFEVAIPEGVRPIYLEDVSKAITGGSRFGAMFRAWLWPKGALERACGAAKRTQASGIATVIFSSGSTGEPKGVLLTHANLAANIEGSSQVMGPDEQDRLLGVLPHFHSFGYFALWFGIHNRMASVFHPNPVDAAAIGPLVEKMRITYLIATPTFLQIYMRRCTPAQFGSLRLVMTGAEKLRPTVRDAFEERFGIRPLEGYGCTECSPVIAVSTFDYRAPGFFQQGARKGSVGQTLPGVAVRAVDPDTFEEVPVGEPGMLLVKGPNVMAGYLGRDDLTEAAMRDGWYVTGDIVRIDDDGFVYITDRLSRFSKIGGEMVPHGVVEDALHEALQEVERTGPGEQRFAVTGVPDERKGEQLVVLHKVDESHIPRLLELLSEKGLPNLFLPRAGAFVKVDEIPLLGTGKTDLKSVRQIAAERCRSS